MGLTPVPDGFITHQHLNRNIQPDDTAVQTIKLFTDLKDDALFSVTMLNTTKQAFTYQWQIGIQNLSSLLMQIQFKWFRNRQSKELSLKPGNTVCEREQQFDNRFNLIGITKSAIV